MSPYKRFCLAARQICAGANVKNTRKQKYKMNAAYYESWVSYEKCLLSSSIEPIFLMKFAMTSRRHDLRHDAYALRVYLVKMIDDDAQRVSYFSAINGVRRVMRREREKKRASMRLIVEW